jgi:molybdenum-dependent DNA-binding transcriptional regulator ModE
MEKLLMSRKERVRLIVMQQVKADELTVTEACEVLGLSYRQTKRVWRRYRLAGDQGLVHGSRGRPGKRAKPAKLKARILARYEERYADFGPTLAAEYLATEGMLVDHETLRRWRLAQGKPRLRRRRQCHRQWRERKPCFGAMAQLDGSHHDWFEGRGPRCVLMVMVDDATNRVGAQLFEQETTRASYEVFDDWTQQAGLPQSLYVDRDSIYRCEAVGSVAEQLAGKEPQTQFGRAMKQLGVELILANSPQAKGRVERMNGVLQDRLVKALRLEGISDIPSANTFLRKKFLPAFNRRFQVQAASPADVHQQPPRELNEILSWEVERVVQRDWTVASGGRWYQLDRQHEALSLAGKKVIVRTLRDGAVQLERGGMKLKWKELSGRPQRRSLRPAQSRPAQDWKPAAAHPWRLGRVARTGRLTTAGPQGARAKARSSPPARSIDNSRLGNYTDNNNKGTLSPELLRGHF